MKNRRKLLNFILASTLFTTTHAMSKTLEISVTNLTFGSYFTPILISTHNQTDTQRLFKAGEPASSFLGVKEMAETGDITLLANRVASEGALVLINPVEEGGIVTNNRDIPAPFLANGGTVTTYLEIQGWQKYLSLSAMILPSNDAFVGIDSYKIPRKSGTYRIFLNAYDAGTEVNDELKVSMPPVPSSLASALALGDGGTGVDTELTAGNSKIHLHRGNIGDFDSAGGISDMDTKLHRWNNPVAVVTLVVGK